MKRCGRLGLMLLLGVCVIGAADLPPGYSVSRQFGKPCRIDTQFLPWLVYNTDPRYSHVVNHAVTTWNTEGLRLGIGPFYQMTSEPDQAALVIDWSGKGLPSDKAGGIFWDVNLGYKRVVGLSMDGQYRVPEGNRTQILMQELGHVLGLDHSQERTDVMYSLMQTRRLPRIIDARITSRDRAALEWLYSQPSWVPILSLHQPLLRAPATPQPIFTPLPAPTDS